MKCVEVIYDGHKINILYVFNYFCIGNSSWKLIKNKCTNLQDIDHKTGFSFRSEGLSF